MKKAEEETKTESPAKEAEVKERTKSGTDIKGTAEPVSDKSAEDTSFTPSEKVEDDTSDDTNEIEKLTKEQGEQDEPEDFGKDQEGDENYS